MKIYTVHVKKDAAEPLKTALFVSEGGFNLWAGLFHLFWALYKRMWLVAALLFAAQSVLIAIDKSGLIHANYLFVIHLGFFVYIALSASDWYRSSLDHRGYILMDVVTAHSELEAKAKFLGSYTNDETIVQAA